MRKSLEPRRLVERTCSKRLLWAGTLATLVAVGMLNAQDTSRLGLSSPVEKIHREGTRFDQQAVTFRAENDQLVVLTGNDSRSIQVLENLAAQRIYRANRDDPQDNRWTISGVFTEFEGHNYLILEQAVRIR